MKLYRNLNGKQLLNTIMQRELHEQVGIQILETIMKSQKEGS